MSQMNAGHPALIAMSTPDKSGSRTSAVDRGNRQTDQKVVGLSDNRISGVWLNPYPIVHCSAEPLFAAKIFFSSLHGHMPQQELNLF
jgi:hypothetical protein